MFFCGQLRAWKPDTFPVLTANVSRHLCAFPHNRFHIKQMKQTVPPISWQLFLTNVSDLRALKYYRNDAVVERMILALEQVVTANLTPLIIMERKAVGWEARWEHFRDVWAPSEPPCDSRTEKSSARTHMCCSGSQKATHALSKSQRKKSKASLTACAFRFFLKNTLGFTGLSPSFGVRAWVLIFKQSHWGITEWNAPLHNEILMKEIQHV